MGLRKKSRTMLRNATEHYLRIYVIATASVIANASLVCLCHLLSCFYTALQLNCAYNIYDS